MAGLLNDTTMQLLSKSLDYRTSRHDLLASNIANKDTPGYKAEDMVFEKALGKALNADKPGPLRTTDPRHMDANFTPPLELHQPERIQSANAFPSFNGNTVDIDREMAKVAENQLMYNATAKMVAHKIKLMKTALNDGR